MPQNISLNKEVVINNKKIGPGNNPYIVAEIGLNHNGSIKLAKELIIAAKNCGCHAVKFQTFSADKRISKKIKTVNYAEKITKPGFIIMDSPGYDTPSISGLVSSGANIVCFTTGRGTPTGNPIVPVLKIATNSQMFKHMEENMDINAGTIVDGTQTLEEVGQKIFQKIISVASGEPTKNELTGHREFAIWRVGAVL